MYARKGQIQLRTKIISMCSIQSYDVHCSNSRSLLHKEEQCHLFSRLLSKNLKIKMYRTVILPVVLYGCETWSLTLREERKLRLFENMVLRRIFGPRGGRGNGGMEEIA